MLVRLDHNDLVADNQFTLSDGNILRSRIDTIYADESTLLGELTDFAGNAQVSLQTHNVLAATGNLLVSGNHDLRDWRFGSQNEVGLLTLQSTADLTLQGSMGDGFAASGWLLDEDSWSFNLVAGRDTGSVAPMDTLTDSADLILANNAVLRTGTGELGLAAGRDLRLSNQSSVIYTAGRSDYTTYPDPFDIDAIFLRGDPDSAAPVVYPDSGILHFAELSASLGTLFYPTAGGDIRISTGRDLIGAASNQLPSSWLPHFSGEILLSAGFRPSKAVDLTTWGVHFDRFQQGIAALGGGNIDVQAGRNIQDLSLSIPTTGKLVAPLADAGSVDEAIAINGGGNARITSGGDIQQLNLLIERGIAEVRAAGDIGSGANGIGSILMLSDASLQLRAGGDLQIDAVSNSTALPLSRQLADNRSNYFFTYASDAELDLLALTGDVIFNNNTAAVVAAKNDLNFASSDSTQVGQNRAGNWNSLRVLPPKLKVTAATGDIEFRNSDVSLVPSVDNELVLAAARNIRSMSESGTANPTLRIADADGLPTALDSAVSYINAARDDIFTRLFGVWRNPLTHAAKPYADNDSRAWIVARDGNIESGQPLNFDINMPATIKAGTDLRNVSFYLQHNTVADKSFIEVGGDLAYNISTNPETGLLKTNLQDGITVAGPGRLEVIAGGDINLGGGAGIVSIGNRDNPALTSATGAAIRLLAGIGDEPDYTGFADTYLSNSDSFTDQWQAFLTEDVQDALLLDLVNSHTGQTEATTRDEALAVINTLSETERVQLAREAFDVSGSEIQRDLIFRVYVDEVREGGIQDLRDESAEGLSGFARSYAAIEQLFSSATEWAGDIRMIFSTVQTQRGGDLSLIAPGGDIDVGLAAQFAGLNKRNTELGIQVLGAGDVQAVVDGSINVNASRILALDGGDIMLWSSFGDIDAGRGAKTALTIPPPQTVFDPDTGSFVVIVSPTVAGSGIQAAASSREPGSVFLFAPNGIVDAGDAGISSQGDVLIAAQQVLGADNIDVGGISIGIPTASALGASLAGIGDVASSATDSASEAMNQAMTEAANSIAESNVAFVTVDIIGIGK